MKTKLEEFEECVRDRYATECCDYQRSNSPICSGAANALRGTIDLLDELGVRTEQERMVEALRAARSAVSFGGGVIAAEVSAQIDEILGESEE